MADTGAKGIREREEACVWRGRNYMKMTKNRIQSDILERSLPEEVLSVLLKDRTTVWVLNWETGMPIEFRSITEKGGGYG